VSFMTGKAIPRFAGERDAQCAACAVSPTILVSPKFPWRKYQDQQVAVSKNQRAQHESACCTGGHAIVPYEQYTQQFPGFGLRTILQRSHS
jgi:hypothetical protein